MEYKRIDDQIGEIVDKYNSGESISAISRLFGSKYHVILAILQREKQYRPTSLKWTEQEDRILIDNYETVPMDTLLTMLPGRGRKAIVTRSHMFSLINFKYFTDRDVRYIVENWETSSDADIAVAIGRTRRSIKWKRGKLGLFRTITCSGSTGIYDYLHKRNKNWRVLSMEACNYRCVITGEPVDVVHHLQASNLILDEVLCDIGLDHRRTVGEYSDDELELILGKYVEKHAAYPLGVCLTEDIHKLFHKNFGYGNNTPGQFQLFKQKYLSGAYNA